MSLSLARRTGAPGRDRRRQLRAFSRERRDGYRTEATSLIDFEELRIRLRQYPSVRAVARADVLESQIAAARKKTGTIRVV